MINTGFTGQDITLIIGLIGVAGILLWGIITMGMGGKRDNKSKANKIMRYRIIMQAVVILIFLILLFYRSKT